MYPNDVASPCINICKIDEPTQRCTGCDRSIEEITLWSRMDNDAKQAVIDGIVLRNRESRNRKMQSGHDAVVNLTTQPQRKAPGDPPISDTTATNDLNSRPSGNE